MASALMEPVLDAVSRPTSPAEAAAAAAAAAAIKPVRRPFKSRLNLVKCTYPIGTFRYLHGTRIHGSNTSSFDPNPVTTGAEIAGIEPTRDAKFHIYWQEHTVTGEQVKELAWNQVINLTVVPPPDLSLTVLCFFVLHRK
jgi:hypothetical protein